MISGTADLTDEQLAFELQAMDWIGTDPQMALIELDRELVRVGGLAMFAELAWPQVESEGSFKGNWHINEIAAELENVSRGENRRLAIAVPPRSMKSLLVSCFWPAWDWIANPQRRFLFASYAQNLSIRDNMKCRRIIQSPWYQARWGGGFKLASDQNAKGRFENDRHGYRLATSVDAQVTGEGGDFVVVDDPHNVRQAESEATREGTVRWFDEAMQSRLNDPTTGAFVVIQQRVHQRDLIGHVMAPGRRAKPYRYCCLPAEFDPDHPHVWKHDPRKEKGELLWPSRVPREELEELKASLGIYAAAAQLQQLPAPREGGIFKRHWFPIIQAAPGDTVWVRGWDFAGTLKKEVKSDPDFTATVLVGWSRATRKWIIGHADHWQVEQHEVERLVVSIAEQDHAAWGQRVRIKIPQDPAAAGKAMAQRMMTLLSRWQAKAGPVTGDKMQRALPLAGQAGVGNVQMLQGPWNDAFLEELTGFPTAAHDDWVDSASEAFNEHATGTGGILEFYRQKADDVAPEETVRANLEAEWRATGASGSVEIDPQTQKPTMQSLVAALYGTGSPSPSGGE